MNLITITVGVAVLLFGLYITILRYKRPQSLKRLEALKDLFGDKTGDMIHLGAYSIIPLISGAMFVFAGVKGISLF